MGLECYDIHVMFPSGTRVTLQNMAEDESPSDIEKQIKKYHAEHIAGHEDTFALRFNGKPLTESKGLKEQGVKRDAVIDVVF